MKVLLLEFCRTAARMTRSRHVSSLNAAGCLTGRRSIFGKHRIGLCLSKSTRQPLPGPTTNTLRPAGLHKIFESSGHWYSFALMYRHLVFLLCALAVSDPVIAQSGAPSQPGKPSLADAESFIANAEVLLNDLTVKASRAQWVQSTFITDDTEIIAAEANEQVIEAQTKLAEEIKRFNGLTFTPELDRKFLLLRLGLFSLTNPKDREEVAKLGTWLEGAFGKGK